MSDPLGLAEHGRTGHGPASLVAHTTGYLWAGCRRHNPEHPCRPLGPCHAYLDETGVRTQEHIPA